MKVGYGRLMSSYFTLEFDSTSPHLTITMPTRTIPQNVVEIEIKSNEILATYQDIYIIDAVGIRHDYIFNKLDDYTYYGLVDFQTFPLGIATLYVRLKDEVFNESELYSKNINVGYIVEQIECFISMKERNSNVSMVERESNVNIFERKNSIQVIERNKNIQAIERNKYIKVVG